MRKLDPMGAIRARRFLADRSTAFGFREGVRGRPFMYDFHLTGADPQNSAIMYEHGRQVAALAAAERIDPGFYPEGQPSAALVALVLRNFDFPVDAPRENGQGVLR